MTTIAEASPEAKVSSIDTSSLIDQLFASVLSVIAVGALQLRYQGATYLFVSIIGTLLAAVVVRISKVVKVFPGFVALCAVVGYILIGVPLALSVGNSQLVAPTPGNVVHFLVLTVQGWRDILTIRPPVGLGDGLLVVPFFLGVVSGLFSNLIALKSKSFVLPAIPIVVTATVSILFGGGYATFPVVTGSIFGIGIMLWCTLRYRRSIQVAHRRTSHATKRVISVSTIATSIALSPLLGPHLPFTSSHTRLILARYVVPPFNVADLSSPLAKFRNFEVGSPQSLAHVPMYRVNGLTQGTLLPISVMDNYNDVVFGFADNGSNDAYFRHNDSISIASGSKGGGVTISTLAPIPYFLPVVSNPASISLVSNSQRSFKYLYYNSTTGSALSPDLLSNSKVTLHEATLPVVTPTARELNNAQPGAIGAISYVIPQQIQSHLQQMIGSASTPWAKVMAIASFLKKDGKFSSGTESPPLSAPGEDLARLNSFIAGDPVAANAIVGDGEQYSSALALAAYAAGVPSRVVLGAEVPSNGIVTGSDIAAWVQVLFNGYGWVNIAPSQFIPTAAPKRQVVVPAPSQKVSPPLATPIANGLGSNSIFVPQRGNVLAHAPKINKVVTPFVIPVFVKVAAGIILAPSLLVIALAGVTSIGIRRRRRMRITKGATSRRIASGWGELVDVFAAHGIVVPSRSTRMEQAKFLADFADPSRVIDLAYSADAAVYGFGEVPDSEVGRYWSSIDEVLTTTKGNYGIWKRFKVAINPRSIAGVKGAKGTRKRGK